MEVKRLKRCHWPGCNSSNSQAKKCNFFYFPRDERALKWLEVMRSPLLRSRASPPTLLYISRGLRICHIHFSDSLFENPKTKKRLAKGAVPDIPDGENEIPKDLEELPDETEEVECNDEVMLPVGER